MGRDRERFGAPSIAAPFSSILAPRGRLVGPLPELLKLPGRVVGNIAARRGLISDTEMKGNAAIITAEVPLANMFGYSTDLRSLTQGRAAFSMEFACYRRTPQTVQEEIIERTRKENSAARLVGPPPTRRS